MIRIVSALALVFAALSISSCGCKPKLKTPPMQPLPAFQDPRTLDTSVGEPQVVAEPEEVEIEIIDGK